MSIIDDYPRMKPKTNVYNLKVGDLVVLCKYANDFAKKHNIIYTILKFENYLKTLAILKDKNGDTVTSSTEHLHHATKKEIKAGKRLR